jgi:Ca2+-binding RTX toxin-like protein
MARLTGSNRNDVFSVGASQLQSLQLRAGRGYDTLKITGGSNASISSYTTAQWRELEAIDLTLATGAVNLSVSATLLSNSNTRALDITISNASHLTLASSTAGVSLFGSGHVQLANGSNNIVSIASGNVLITGGTGADRITASTFGNTLDGGGGNDSLVGNSGTDVFVHTAGSGSDIIVNFSVANDSLDLSGHPPLNFWDIQKSMSSQNGGTLIALPNGSLFIEGVSPGALTREDFQQNGAAIAEFGEVVVIGTGTSAATINDVLARVPDGTTVVFADGVHVLDAPLLLGRGNITIAGASTDGVTIQFDFPAGVGGDFITIGNAEKTYLTATAQAASAGSTTLELAIGGGLQVGDAVYLYQPNTAEYLAANGWTNVSMEEAASRPFREFITTVTAVNGTQVTLADAVPYDFAAAETRVFALSALENVTVRDLTISSALNGPNAFNFSNSYPEFDGASAFAASGTIGLQLFNLTVSNSPSTAISLSSSIHTEVQDITISGSHNKGSDGNGYGVLLTESFNNVLSGLTITDMRHAIVFSAWSAETGNTIAADFINRDVNFHGSPDVGNTVTVGRAILSYDTAVDPSMWSLVSSGGSNHAATDIWGDNMVRFSHAEGSGNVDSIQGADGGSYLNGHGSNDVLVGGSGDDVIVGGLRRDTLTGGDGSDTFIFKMGDDLDIVTDMAFGSGGDHIVILGNPTVDGYGDLVFTQEGADLRVRYGSNSTFILKDTATSDVDVSNFIFDPLGTTYLDDWNGGL